MAAIPSVSKSKPDDDYATIALIQQILRNNADATFRDSGKLDACITFLDCVREEIAFFDGVNAKVVTA